MSEFMQVMNERSTIRAYRPQMLTEEEIRLLVNAGLQAPTARNAQEIFISVVKASNPLVAEIRQALNPDMQKNNFYYNAPVLFFLSGKDDFRWTHLDAGIAVENMHLAAKDMGLGSVILGCIDKVMLGEKKAYFDEKLKVPEGYSFEIAFAAGYPDTGKAPHEFDIEKNAAFVD